MKSEKLKIKNNRASGCIPLFFRTLFFTLTFSLFTLLVFAQEDAPKDSVKKVAEPKDTILDKGRYKREYNWTIIGAGLAQNKRGLDGNMGINYQFRGKHPDISNE